MNCPLCHNNKRMIQKRRAIRKTWPWQHNDKSFDIRKPMIICNRRLTYWVRHHVNILQLMQNPKGHMKDSLTLRGPRVIRVSFQRSIGLSSTPWYGHKLYFAVFLLLGKWSRTFGILWTQWQQRNWPSHYCLLRVAKCHRYGRYMCWCRWIRMNMRSYFISVITSIIEFVLLWGT